MQRRPSSNDAAKQRTSDGIADLCNTDIVVSSLSSYVVSAKLFRRFSRNPLLVSMVCFRSLRLTAPGTLSLSIIVLTVKVNADLVLFGRVPDKYVV